MDVAIDLSDPMNNKSSQRLAADHRDENGSRAPEDYLKEINSIFVRLACGPHYELRMAAALAFTELAKLPEAANKGKILSEMTELLDDEQQEVAIVALK